MFPLLAEGATVTLEVAVLTGWVVAAFTTLGTSIAWLVMRRERDRERFDGLNERTAVAVEKGTAAMDAVSERLEKLEGAHTRLDVAMTRLEEASKRLEARPTCSR